ncbi:MAG: hypothetical protein E7096_06945 [Bacteroides sp.]|nr:hypothetical protein [Bacteroides sp.]
MKFQELLQSVDFKKVALAFERMYPDDKHMLPFLKCHYDILCHITPIYDENANAQECRISYIYDEIVNKSYLSAFPLEGDKWSASLCKEIIIDCDVNATKEEIVACCLWHTSFWGYTEEQLSETAKDFNIYSDKADIEISLIELTGNLQELEKLGCKIDSLPTYTDVKSIVKMRANLKYSRWKQKYIKKHIRNRMFRRDFLRTEHYNYINSIACFILDICKYSSNRDNHLLLDFCKLFQSKRFAAYSYQSRTYGKSDSAEYLIELITRYNAFDKEYIFSNLILCIEKASIDLTLTTCEQNLCDCIWTLCPNGTNRTIITVNPSLKSELKIIVAFYE